MSERLSDTMRRFLEAADERGWDVIAFDMNGTIELRNPDGHIEMTLRGLLITPDFIRSLPMATRTDRAK